MLASVASVVIYPSIEVESKAVDLEAVSLESVDL